MGAPIITPLRYPGGKSRLAKYFGDVIKNQLPRPKVYAEPFAGGAGAALALLKLGITERAVINDLDRGVAAFWRSVFYDTDRLAAKIRSTPVNMEHWSLSRSMYKNPDGVRDLELGFATFFLNRTNRSGILNAGPIGGKSQSGKWKIDARFNRERLAERIEELGTFRTRVVIEEADALDLLQDLVTHQDEMLLYVDPPYVDKGSDLYLNQLDHDYHRSLAAILNESNYRWILTYDMSPLVRDEIYMNRRRLAFDISHTAQEQHIGSEIMIFSDNIDVPHIDVIPRGAARWIHKDS